MSEVINKFLKKYDNLNIQISVILVIYIFTTFAIWKKYSWHPTSMLHFGNEFVEVNLNFMPAEAIVEKGYEGDLGAGYDGQIFYFYSRSLNSFPLKWPVGFDENYRAPRIGYPFLSALFGVVGPNGTIFGMYFWNLFLFILSVILLRKILGENSYLVWFYIFSPFSLGSYSVLVSDSVLISLIIIAYYFYTSEKYFYFCLTASLAVLTKEPSLFLFFPMGLRETYRKNFKNMLIILSILIIPIIWHMYLRYSIPNWKSSRIFELIVPFEGIISYLKFLFTDAGGDWRETARALSKLPFVLLLILGIYSLLRGDLKKGFIFRVGLVLNFTMIIMGSYYHFWSVYENVSRLFTLSIPLMILLASEDGIKYRKYYLYLAFIQFVLFLVRISLIQKPMEHFLWTP